ncbi:MAG: sulfatase-like hydrolase/transferase, partial [Planctomycetota bacterium]
MLDTSKEAERNKPVSKTDYSNRLFSRRSFLNNALAGVGALSAGGACVAQAKKQQPQTAAKGPKNNGLNIIVIVADTWRIDHLGCYLPSRVKTPFLDEFAAQSIVFTNAHAEGLPTIPCRRVYHTGKSVLPEAGWRPLKRENRTFAEVLKKRGFTSAFIVDTYHHFKPDYNFHRGFDTWEWIRGQEFDPWRSGPKAKFDAKKHIPPHLWNKDYDYKVRQYLMNTQDFETEDDYFAAQTCRAA